jgi:RNA ligase
MKLHELINVKELEELIEEGYVSDRKHPSLPLRILNYTPKAVEIKEWRDTLSYCRGLVYEITSGELCAIPFKKFWNHGDERHIKSLPAGVPRIFEKADGSYLNLFFYKGLPVVSTRGSFESDQAKWAQKWVDANLKLDNITYSDQKFNFIYEVIVPEDRKVVSYDFSGLIFLGYTRLLDGAEFEPYKQFTWFSEDLVRTAKEHAYEDLEKLQAQDLPNEEGYVAVWYNSNAPAFRVKLKFETYKLLHRMYFQTTAEVIWEMLKNGSSRLDIDQHLKGADSSLINWAMAVAFNILVKRGDSEHKSKEEFKYAIGQTNMLCDLEAPEKERRKAFAMYATKAENPQLLFLLYDASFEKYEEALWKIAKPENSRFRDSGEEE